MNEEARTPRDGESITSLREAAAYFFAQPGPRRMAAYAAGAWAARAALGPPSLADAGVCAAVVAGWPLQEWLAHKHLLHLEPGEGRTDPLFAQKHRAHHAAPRDVRTAFLPLEVIDAAMPANVGAWLLGLGRTRAAATGIAAYATMALVYEWTHFLVHTGVAPKSALYTKIRRYHRLHHFRSEQHWFGFTAPWIDEVLGTAPDPKTVPVSKTARDLFGLIRREAEAL